MTCLQHWSSGFECALSSVLAASREAEASSFQQFRAEIESRDATMTEMSQRLDSLRATNTNLVSQLASISADSERAILSAQEEAQRSRDLIADAESRCLMLEAKLDEQTKRHDEYAGFISEVRERSLWLVRD
jgi:septal ring factor EnvC (AmiA/AmiB activator)